MAWLQDAEIRVVLSFIALLDQEALDVQFPIINARNMTAVVGTPLAQGRLAGGNFYGQEDNTPTALKVSEIKQICESYNVDIVRITDRAGHVSALSRIS